MSDAEETVREGLEIVFQLNVGIRFNIDSSQWEIDPAAMNGEELYSEGEGLTDIREPNEAEYEILEKAATTPLPTGHELAALLNDYIATHP